MFISLVPGLSFYKKDSYQNAHKNAQIPNYVDYVLVGSSDLKKLPTSEKFNQFLDAFPQMKKGFFITDFSSCGRLENISDSFLSELSAYDSTSGQKIQNLTAALQNIQNMGPIVFASKRVPENVKRQAQPSGDVRTAIDKDMLANEQIFENQTVSEEFQRSVDFCSRRQEFFYCSMENIESGDYKTAIRLLSSLQCNFPYCEEIYFRRGIAYMRDFQYKKALTDFSIALQLFPNHHEARLKRGELYTLTRHYEDAEKDFSYVIKHDKTNVLAKKLLHIANECKKQYFYEKTHTYYEDLQFVYKSAGINMPLEHVEYRTTRHCFKDVKLLQETPHLEEARTLTSLFAGDSEYLTQAVNAKNTQNLGREKSK